MKRFYKILRYEGKIVGPLPMDHDACLKYVCESGDINMLTIDIKHWRDNAKHNDVFRINSDFWLLCFDIDEHIQRASEGVTEIL